MVLVARIVLILTLVMCGTVAAQGPIWFVTGRPILWLVNSKVCDHPNFPKDVDCNTDSQPGYLEPGTRVQELPDSKSPCTDLVGVRVLDGASKGNVGCVAAENLTGVKPQ
jgi:hypothetical protein